eukprot:TRINITY_DN6469_c0_g1_i3.p1 TRINITY_DN6469_c0_g1~~TRINITY_DN6469_c0_g1_i3.p1  ORF type:complete len:495 (+),score=25.58 TRINITY_DN6469_c0_g1_i3:92-1576(+)
MLSNCWNLSQSQLVRFCQSHNVNQPKKYVSVIKNSLSAQGSSKHAAAWYSSTKTRNIIAQDSLQICNQLRSRKGQLRINNKRTVIASALPEYVIGRTLSRNAIYISLIWIGTGFLLKLIAQAQNTLPKEERQQQTITTLLNALYDPLRVFLPFLAILLSGQVLIKTLRKVDACEKIFPIWVNACIDYSLVITEIVEKFMVKLLGILWIVFALWVVLRLRDVLIERAIQYWGKEIPEKMDGARRAIQPIGKLSGWILMAVGIILSLDIIGLNLQPLLASVGVGSIVVGIAAQNTIANTLSGVSLFLSQPFVAGDMVKVIGEKGEMLARGTVQEVMPMRTILRGEEGETIYVPNGTVVRNILSNESPVLSLGLSTQDLVSRNNQRRISLNFQVKTLRIVDNVVQQIQEILKKETCIDQHLPKGAAITAVQAVSEEAAGANVPILSVWAYSKDKLDESAWTDMRQRLIIEVSDIIDKESSLGQLINKVADKESTNSI